jgi:hypothetical protein
MSFENLEYFLSLVTYLMSRKLILYLILLFGGSIKYASNKSLLIKFEIC